jgi:hypothetical protein
VLAADCIEADDFYIGARAGGTRGRGTEQQPMLAAVDRAPAGRGSCAIRCAQDCSGDSWRQFGHDHLCHASRIRADAWSGIAAGLSSFRGLEQKEYDSSDGDASLPMVHRVISNFKAYVEGAFHSLSKKAPAVICGLLQLEIQPQELLRCLHGAPPRDVPHACPALRHRSHGHGPAEASCELA